MKHLFKNAVLLTENGILSGNMLTENGLIVSLGPSLASSADRVTDLAGKRAFPGLVDIHTHGRAGGDFVSASSEKLLEMSDSYLSAGVTTVVPTFASAPLEDFITASENIASVSFETRGARFVGIHLEGRYLNPEKRGAHAPELLAPLDADELCRLLDAMQLPFSERNLSPVLRLSAAFELDPSGFFESAAKARGVTLSLGHTSATYAEAKRSVDRGVTCFTHLYNAMPPLHHREGGAVLACFDDSRVMGEIICDGFHICPEMVRLAYRMLGTDRLILITDSMEGTGCPDGNYSIAGMPVILKDGKAYTVDGHIAGSTLGLWDAVRNLSAFCSISLEEAVLCASRNPARQIGLYDTIGSLSVGKRADFIVLNEDDTIESVYVGGTGDTGHGCAF